MCGGVKQAVYHSLAATVISYRGVMHGSDITCHMYVKKCHIWLNWMKCFERGHCVSCHFITSLHCPNTTNDKSSS